RVLAIDISVSVHQFLSGKPELYNRDGTNISVLQGLFYRTVDLLENGIKPVYVFDGRPPDLKRLKVNANTSVQKRMATQPIPGPGYRSDLQTMLTHLGVPFIQAPSEAEATCAALVSGGQAWGTVTEDMDALPFGSTRLLRNLKADKKQTIEEYDLPKILEELKMEREQFVDLCILLGCDYSGTIRGVGWKKALRMMREHGSIDGILGAIDQQKHPVPPDFHYSEARRLFLNPEVVDVKSVQLEWKTPDRGALVQFLTHERHIKKVDSRLEKLLSGGPTKKRKSVARKSGIGDAKIRKMTDYYAVKKGVVQGSDICPPLRDFLETSQSQEEEGDRGGASTAAKARIL
ncbi:flap endonuclease 1-like, partial [Discoglossus pictus]